MKTKTPPTQPTPPPVKPCKVKGCGRPNYARGYCQTHHRQFLRTGKVSPIRRYRPRSPGTLKFAGLRLSPQTVEALQELAEAEGLSDGAAIAQVLEEWHAQRSPKPKKPRG